MVLVNLNGSKENTEYIVNSIKDFLTIPNINNEFMAGVVAMIHTIFGLYTLKSICFTGMKNYNPTLIIITWVIIIYSNYYFHGCLLTRLEMAFYNKNENWYGPASFFFHIFGLKQTKTKINNAIKYGIAFPFSVILIVRLFFARNFNISRFLFLVLTPLLYINSQATLFNGTDSTKQLKNSKSYTKLKNKNIIVSGASSGIGLAVTKELLSHNANVICLMRNSKHAEDNYKALKKIYGDKINRINVDYISLSSIKSAIKNINLQYKDGIDILFNNAGISNTKPNLTEDGYEAQIQTNCISHIALTEGIMSQIENRNGVIINHSSLSHNIPPKPYNSIFFKKHKNLDKFKGFLLSQQLYQQSKLGLLLYTQILQKRLMNKNIRTISFHPGACKTNLFESSILPPLIIKIIDRFSINTSDVIPSLLDCMVSTQFNDKYIIYGPSNISINKDIIHSTEVDNFQKDVVSQFII